MQVVVFRFTDGIAIEKRDQHFIIKIIHYFMSENIALNKVCQHASGHTATLWMRVPINDVWLLPPAISNSRQDVDEEGTGNVVAL